MTSPTHEHTLNVALGEVLSLLRQSWTTRTEQTGQILLGGGRPDILIEEANGWPVVIEAERSNHASAEVDAKARLGRTVTNTGRQIETSIALVYPANVRSLDGAPLRNALDHTPELEYALYTRQTGGPPERLPSGGWITGGVRDLAMLVQRAAVPPPRIEALAIELENGVRLAAEEFTQRHGHGSELGAQVASILGQSDDDEGQTRRMAMTVIANALIFHESLAEVGFQVTELEGVTTRGVRNVESFRPGGLFSSGEVCLEWESILSVNYWPIFWSAKEMLRRMPIATAHAVLNWLWRTGQKLVAGGVTRSHDLTGIVFQRLIADRKFLATYYTRPEAAALLAALALPANRPLGGSEWGDGETLASAQIGDFACGTGTLLSTAYQRMSLLHELHGGKPRQLHGPMMRHGLVGLDVLNIAVHLTAAMLAGSHPDTPFDGECLLAMPYGQQEDGSIAVGSLDLLAEHVQPSLMDTAAAVSAGGRAPEEVRDLVSRMGHAKFDLVIMNPPFTRPTNHEADRANVPIPSFAAFETTPEEQSAMSDRVKALTQGAPSHGNAGEASEFVELAHRKVREDGLVAIVLPLSSMSGNSWTAVRDRWREQYDDIIVVTVAGTGPYDSSFSADTGMAECLFVGKRATNNDCQGSLASQKRATFVILRQQVRSAVAGELLACEVMRLREAGQIQELEDAGAVTYLRLGEDSFGVVIDAPLPKTGPWSLAGIADGDLAKAAYHLELGTLLQVGQPSSLNFALPIVPLGQLSDRGPVDRDINGQDPGGKPRGPFEVIKPPVNAAPTYPILWAHDATRERSLVVSPDSEGHIKAASAGVTQAQLLEKAARISGTSTRAHYNRDLRFNSQSLIVAMTEQPCIGGMAWPSVIFENPDLEYVFALWCNSTLGLLMHWWVTNKTQSGRGRTTVTGIPNIPTLDLRTLTSQQVAAAKAAFQDLSEWRFFPFDQIDEDPARAELDRRLVIDVLGLPEMLVEPGGTLDLLRHKLAQEPQIHGGKQTRVVFNDAGGEGKNMANSEGSEPRTDR